MYRRLLLKPSVLESLPTGGLPLVLAMVLAVGAPLGVTAEEAADAAEPGREQFLAHKCELCHGVAAAGIASRAKTAKMEGPDLSAYHTDEPETLAAYLRKQSEGEGGKHKREFKGSDEELQLILDWLESLEAAEETETEDGGE